MYTSRDLQLWRCTLCLWGKQSEIWSPDHHNSFSTDFTCVHRQNMRRFWDEGWILLCVYHFWPHPLTSNGAFQFERQSKSLPQISELCQGLISLPLRTEQINPPLLVKSSLKQNYFLKISWSSWCGNSQKVIVSTEYRDHKEPHGATWSATKPHLGHTVLSVGLAGFPIGLGMELSSFWPHLYCEVHKGHCWWLTKQL